SNVYDKARRAELRRSVWTFSARRAVLRKTSTSTQKIGFPTWSATGSWAAGDVVKDSTGYLWIAPSAPSTTAPGTEGYYPVWIPYFGQMYANPHDTTVTYYPGDVVSSSGSAYLCVAQSLNHAPPNTSFWHALSGSPTLTSLVTIAPGGYQFK